MKQPAYFKPESVGTATPRPKASGKRIATATATDDEEDDPAPAAKPKAAAKPAAAKNTSTNDDDENSASTASTNRAKSASTDDSTNQSPTKQSANKAKSTDDTTTNDNQPQSSRAPSSSRTSGANVDADLASCRQAQSKAQQCCGSPASCLTGQDRANYYQLVNGGGGDDDGLTDTCDRLNKASALSGDLNGKVAALCTNNQYACQNTCAALVTKYQNLADSCGDDCDDYSTYQDAISSLRAQQTTCASMSAKADALSIQSLSSGADQGMAAACQQRAGADSGMGTASVPSGSRNRSSSADAGSSGSPQGSSATPTTYAATSAPNARLSAGGSTELAQLSSGYGGDAGRGGTYYGQVLPGAANGQASVRPVPNGGGGFGAGGSASAARGPTGPPRPAPGNSLISTDIEQGYRSGGYSAPVGEDPAQAGQRAGGGRGLASTGAGGDLSGYEGMDLKQYLPGGAYYRHEAGVAGQRSEINGKEEDIFRRISAKYLEKCKLGVLWRCQD